MTCTHCDRVATHGPHCIGHHRQLGGVVPVVKAPKPVAVKAVKAPKPPKPAKVPRPKPIGCRWPSCPRAHNAHGFCFRDVRRWYAMGRPDDFVAAWAAHQAESKAKWAGNGRKLGHARKLSRAARLAALLRAFAADYPEAGVLDAAERLDAFEMGRAAK